jgi:transcriptional regulator with XRE-family HTH domain
VPRRDTPRTHPDDRDTQLHVLGDTIRQYRQQRGLSQRALAPLAGLDPSYIGQIEQGRRNVTVLALVQIAQALQVPVSHLLAPLDTLSRPEAPPTE